MSQPIPTEVVEHVSHPVIKLLQSRAGLWIVGFISFIESALLVPIITDPFMVAYILANRAKAFWAVIVTTATSVVGGVVAYFMAFFFSDLVVGYFSPATLEHFSALAEQARAETFVISILGAITPIPYTLVGLAVGFVKGNLVIFVLASILGRGLRYAVVGYLTYKFGVHAMEHIRRHLKWITIVTLVLVLGYIALKFL
ncbi:MAG: YqaA family protein [Candidatus Paceibacteria bacterium]